MSIFTDISGGERLWYQDYGYVDVTSGAFALTLGERDARVGPHRGGDPGRGG